MLSQGGSVTGWKSGKADSIQGGTMHIGHKRCCWQKQCYGTARQEGVWGEVVSAEL